MSIATDSNWFMHPDPGQMELGFDAKGGSTTDGLTRWHADRSAAIERAVAELGMPIGRTVEVWLRGGIRLRGILRLRETVLILEERAAWNLELEVDNVSFRPGEVEACTRLD